MNQTQNYVDASLEVLRKNDLGHSTKPAPQLYPHQWSWDSAFIAIGLAHTNLDRALLELETLFNAQWKDGRVPHIVFNPASTDYFPGPDRWMCSELNSDAPKEPATSGIIQPPVHALAVATIAAKSTDAALRARIKTLYPKLVAWHRYLLTQRDPEKLGLITIYHPWESGTDNSPRWDAPLANVTVGNVPAYTRRDTKHVSDPSERPSQAEYDRFLWLVECLKKAKYDDSEVYKTYPFLVKDALMSSIFALSNHAMIGMFHEFGTNESDLADMKKWQTRVLDGILEHSWSHEKKLALDLDTEKGCSQIQVSTCAGLSPILIPGLDPKIARQVVERIFDNDFAGHKDMKYAVVPSTTPGTTGFHPRAYWRGPSWPPINWLYWYGLKQNGFAKEAEALKLSNLQLLERPEAKFGEYFELINGTQLGSADQSWTAATVLDWLAK